MEGPPLPLRLLLLLGILAGACASGPRPVPEDRPLSPFYDRSQRGENTVTQVRPFYWKQEGPEGKKVNILPPLVRYREDHVFRRLHIFPMVFYTARHTPKDEASWFLYVFPFLFLGSDDFLLFPIGGVTHGFLGIDELLMISWPYIRTKQASRHPTDPVVFTTHYFFWPFLAFGSDGQENGRRRFRIAPFYGRTKGRGGYSKGFVMWPFYTWRRSPDSRAWMIFPFYGRDETPTARRTTIMFPFYFRTLDYLTGATDTTLFPFYRRAKGSDNVDARRYWPFYSWSREEYSTTEYAAWPLWRRQYVQSEHQFSKITWVGTIFYRNVHRVRRNDLFEERKRLIWPIGRWQSTSAGYREVAIPLFWPFDSPDIRQEGEAWRPFVSIYHKVVRPNGDRTVSALFGSVMTRRTEHTKKVRLLYGLLGWDRGPDGRYLRLLFGIRLKLSSRP